MFIFAVQGMNVDDLGEAQEGDFNLDLLYNGIMQLVSNMNNYDNRFDKSRNCAVCGQSGHAFDNCDALKDTGQMRQAYIKTCVACSKFRAAFDRLLPGKTNQDLNLVQTITINQFFVLSLRSQVMDLLRCKSCLLSPNSEHLNKISTL